VYQPLDALMVWVFPRQLTTLLHSLFWYGHLIKRANFEYYTKVEVKNVHIYYTELITVAKSLIVPALGCTNGLGFPKTTYNLVTFIIFGMGTLSREQS